eukprot:TRINITY_DN28901_c0_g1_i1.p1 TRINITY_DN28901_c0_g1~~TRINITY_DN28901_c0_g1_i1.p1  ORF type:complete len:364 (+),score=97.54 TRINITY_DN28901_c0_g1_i1:78-1169(+)
MRRAAALTRRAAQVRCFRAVVCSEGGAELREFGCTSELPRQDPRADVTIRVTHTTVNYKDAMILRGQRGVVPNYPIVGGIDCAGVVVSSDSSEWSEGDEVMVAGNKIGQFFDGGYSERLSVRSSWLCTPPPGYSLADTMAVGSAGITAMMCVAHLEEAGGLGRFVGGGEDAPVLVTGAGGGLGCCAVAILSKLGYYVVASTGRGEDLGDWLRELGANEVVPRLTYNPKRPLGKQKWAGVIDAVGSSTLAAAISETRYRCGVASTGVAGGGDLPCTVYPFILRGVRLLGVDSTLPIDVEGYPADEGSKQRYTSERNELWLRLSECLPPDVLAKCTGGTASLDQLKGMADDVIAGRIRGRTVVTV